MFSLWRHLKQPSRTTEYFGVRVDYSVVTVTTSSFQLRNCIYGILCLNSQVINHETPTPQICFELRNSELSIPHTLSYRKDCKPNEYLTYDCLCKKKKTFFPINLPSFLSTSVKKKIIAFSWNTIKVLPSYSETDVTVQKPLFRSIFYLFFGKKHFKCRRIYIKV